MLVLAGAEVILVNRHQANFPSLLLHRENRVIDIDAAHNGRRNERLLCLLRVANRLRAKVGTGEDLRPCSQWP